MIRDYASTQRDSKDHGHNETNKQSTMNCPLSHFLNFNDNSSRVKETQKSKHNFARCRKHIVSCRDVLCLHVSPLNFANVATEGIMCTHGRPMRDDGGACTCGKLMQAHRPLTHSQKNPSIVASTNCSLRAARRIAQSRGASCMCTWSGSCARCAAVSMLQCWCPLSPHLHPGAPCQLPQLSPPQPRLQG